MSTAIAKYTFNADPLDSIEINDTLLTKGIHPQVIKDYTVAMRRNLRQWSASTKGRSEVNHSGQKPHAQKGTGKARQGYLGAPQYKGGGVVFGPKPKFDQHVRINQKERRAAIRYLLGKKMSDGSLVVIQEPLMVDPKTAVIARFLRSMSWTHRVLFVLPTCDLAQNLGNSERVRHCAAFRQSTRNIPKVVTGTLANINAADVLLAKHIAFTQEALDELIANWQGDKSESI